MGSRGSVASSWGVIGAGLASIGLLAAALPLGAQPLPPDYQPPLQRDRPFETEPDLRLPRQDAVELGGEDGRVLPSVPAPSADELEALGAQAGLVVRALELVGNTVFSDEELTSSVATFLGRPLDSSDLERIRRILTSLYVDAGYVNSGARLPEQTVADGRLRIEITEGVLSEIRIEGLEHYRPAVLEARLARRARGPLRVGELESALRILSQDPRIERLDARLEPGSMPGTSVLRLEIDEDDPAALGLAFDNHETPSVGDFAGHADVGHDNPLGFGDSFGAAFSVAEGLYRIGGSYALPVHPSGTLIRFDGRYSKTTITDSTRDQAGDSVLELDIENESASYGFGVSQTLWRTPTDWLEAGLSFDRRESVSTLNGEPFSFSEGLEDGEAKLHVLRGDLSWTRRMRASALALRSTVSYGLDAFDSTISRGSVPDGVFVTWVAQLRFLHRLERSGIELGLRGDLQLADRSLLPLEQFAIGGPGSVRGYATNQLAADQGFSAGIEARTPLVKTATGRSILAITPFAELGRVWNQDRPSFGRVTLASLGAALEWAPHPAFSFRLDWGGALQPFDRAENLQDHGVHFRVEWRPL